MRLSTVLLVLALSGCEVLAQEPPQDPPGCPPPPVCPPEGFTLVPESSRMEDPARKALEALGRAEEAMAGQ